MSTNATYSGNCTICNGSLSDGVVIKLREKGANGINAASVLRGDRLVVSAGCNVHLQCRKRYVNKKEIKLKESDSSKHEQRKSLRVSTGPFLSNSNCLFCGKPVSLEGSDYSHVMSDTFVRKIKECCDSRSDEWAFKVKGRIEYYGGDLYAADCLYHHVCDVNFRTGYDLPFQFRDELSGPQEKRIKCGRPKDAAQEHAFLKVCSYLEMNDEEQLTILDLQEKMKEFLNNEAMPPYSKTWLKYKLNEHYGDTLFITEGKGTNNIVTFRENTSKILRSFYQKSQDQNNEEAQKRVIIDTAARLIRSEIKEKVISDTNHYPKFEDLTLDSALNFIPETLRDLLSKIFVGSKILHKVASIGQAIVQAARPRAVIAPLQIGLAVQMHHHYRSKFLLETLNKMGYSSSYTEMLRFQKNAASHGTSNSIFKDQELFQSSCLFVADNVDHNSITLDGKGTFHGMGMIAALTPGIKRTYLLDRRDMSEIHIVEQSHVDITEYSFAKNAVREVKFKDLLFSEGYNVSVDILWEVSFCFKQPVPNWQGMMHVIHKGNPHSGKSSIQFLPMIDMSPGDKTCILSTLEFISKIAIKHHVPPIITFDQPLYWKASEIIKTAPQDSYLKKIVLMLGSFHTLMNLLGAIGTLMEGTGLEGILEVIYGENAVVHMLSGKAVARAVRGHLLVDNCLHQLLVQSILDDNPDLTLLIDETEDMYSRLLRGETTLETVVSSSAVNRISELLDKKKTEVSGQSKTSKLWVGYQQMLRTARELIKADRTGSWNNHLHAIYNALPIFAAAGHYNYMKSAYLYVQEMSELENNNPEVYKMFQKGLHVIRRTNQFWAGLGCDLVIEQTLMRALKTSGGLTHGSKMTEEQRALWTMAAPIMSEYNIAMQDFNELTFTTSEQHKESSLSRIERDTLDISKLYAKLSACSPFTADPSLRNIINGFVGKEEVNVYDYESVGKSIMHKMLGEPVFSFAFKKIYKAKTMSSSSGVMVSPEKTIDSSLLFQRFLVVSRTGELDLEEVMKYELSAYPTSLFEEKDILRKADKPQLAHAIDEHYNIQASIETTQYADSSTERYVIDGGFLIHKLKWKKGDTYNRIAKQYAEFTVKHYGLATVVFDGYEAGPSIKDNAHKRRQKHIHYPIVHFTGDTEFEGKQEEFLSLGSNKQKLIKLIREEMVNRGCTVIQTEGDADVVIAKTAVNSALEHPTTLIGEDTDLLILLLHFSDADGKPLYFKSDNQSRNIPKVYFINRLKSHFGSEFCTQMLFLHAFTGSDSTSRIYGVGKKTVFQKLLKHESVLYSCANEFTTPHKNPADLVSLGIQAMAVIFGGNSTISLAALRYQILTKKVTSAKSFVKPERLPPTESSTKYHCMRSYYQIMTWMGMAGEMNPENWGWKLVNDELVPIMCNMNAAPDCLLKIIHCSCTTGCGGKRCSCRRYGLPCSFVCGSCQVTHCDNSYDVLQNNDDNE
jgi:hypothetical protein